MSDNREEKTRTHAQTHAERRSMQQKHNWLRHTAMVPKGFIRFQVLGALHEKPMSGSELMEEIENHAGGFWKPSPGSIYPLLAWLQNSGYVKELPTENGLKRYELTKSGKSLLDEQKNIMRKFRDTMGFPKSSFSSFFMKIPPEKADKIRQTMQNAGAAMFQLGGVLQENYSDEAVDEAIKTIEEAIKKLEIVTKKLQGEKENE